MTTYLGNRDNRRLDECRPVGCATADVERVRYLYNGGRLSLGLGAAALVGATWAFFASPKSSMELSSVGSGYRLDVAPTAAGGFAALSGTFRGLLPRLPARHVRAPAARGPDTLGWRGTK